MYYVTITYSKGSTSAEVYVERRMAHSRSFAISEAKSYVRRAFRPDIIHSVSAVRI